MVPCTSDYRTVIDSFSELDVDSILSEIENDLEKHVSGDVIEHLCESVPKIIPCVTDTYSLLRYCLFLVNRLQVPVATGSPRPEVIQDLHEASLHWARNLLFLHGGGDWAELLSNGGTVVHRYLALLSLLEVYTPDLDRVLLDQAGSSPYIDVLIAHLFRTRNSRDTSDLSEILRGWSKSASVDGRATRFLFDLLAEHRLGLLSNAELKDYLADHRLDNAVLCALLRYIGELGETSLLETVYDLIRQPSSDASVLYTLIDVIAQMGDSESIKVLKTVDPNDSSTLSEFISASVRELERGGENGESDSSGGITLVQCAFHGDLTRPGLSSGSGLGTFLRELGNYLAGNDEIKEVYTFSLLPVDRAKSEPLLERLSEKHKLIRIPVSFELYDEALDFLQNEYEIMRAVRRTVERYEIDPSILHIRYTDNASQAVLSLAKRLGKKVVFTLTSDPHKTFTKNNGDFRTMDEPELLRNLNKVFIADSIIDRVDGLLLMGYEGKNSQVLPYFPQLLLDSEIRKKPLKIVAEGVRSSIQLGEQDAGLFPDLLTSHDGNYRLSQSGIDRPVILNVGRLHPLKGQHNLVEAWIESSLNQSYNLVLVGGNLADPSPNELSVIERIERLMENRPELRDHFCHVPAVQNAKVRLLEQSIIRNIQNDLPNVYVCSSFKEEFGISILEGMVAGFLTFAPKRGGASDYIEHGINGFLIETDHPDSIRTDIEAVLHPNNKMESLHEIATRGQQFAKERLDIESIGKDYLDYYSGLLHQG